jgi:hypothetical protein
VFGGATSCPTTLVPTRREKDLDEVFFSKPVGAPIFSYVTFVQSYFLLLLLTAFFQSSTSIRTHWGLGFEVIRYSVMIAARKPE